MSLNRSLHWYAVCSVLSGFAGPLAARAATVTCPESIEVTPTLSSPAAPWTVEASTRRVYLQRVDMYDGHPKAMASLKPDEKNTSTIHEVRWEFDKPRDYTVWAACGYSDTTALLVMPLSDAVARCVARYEIVKSRQRYLLKQIECFER